MKLPVIALLAGLFWLAASGPALAAVLPATPATVEAVLKAAQPGDAITLAPGVYGRTGLRDRSFAPRLTIQAAGATLTGWGMSNVSGLNLIGGTLRPVCPALPCYNAAFDVYGGGDMLFTGQVVSGPDVGVDGYGLRVRQARGVTIEKGVFSGFKVGVVFDHASDFAVTASHFTRNRADGIDVGQGWRGRIEGNVCDAMRPLNGEHPDCVQLWSRPDAPPTSDIVIRNNRAYGPTQGFSGFNHVRNGVDDGGFDRITIEANTVDGAFPQAISLMSGRDSAVRNNRVATYPDAAFRASINTGPGVARCGNTVAPGAGKVGVADAACAP